MRPKELHQLGRNRDPAGDLPLIVAGDSAGAHLALHVGLRGIDEPNDVAAVMAFWPAVDPLAEDSLRLRKDDNPWEGLIGQAPVDGDPATIDSSPLTHVGNGVPVLLVHGARHRRAGQPDDRPHAGAHRVRPSGSLPHHAWWPRAGPGP